ncbi:MAG TPA: ATPase, T2SS/T4P/T4SS family, partial [Sphingomicrobium sp.]
MTDRPSDDWVYLRSCLNPLASALARADVTDIYVNRAGEIWIESLGGTIERQACPPLDEQSLWRLARQVAAWNHQGISREHPLLSASLPDGARIQIVAPPATRGPIAIAIRKHVSASLSLDDYAAHGGFDTTMVSSDDQGAEPLASIAAALEATNVIKALRLAVTSRQNILISGGTSTGKTTFLNALLREVPRSERLVTIEDTPELQIGHENAVGLIAVRGALGEAQVSANDLVTASLRLRPDR